MIARYLVPTAFAVCAATTCANADTPAPGQAGHAVEEKSEPVLLDPQEYAPQRMFAPPPARNSPVEAEEMRQLKAMRTAASPQRIAQAERDSEEENPVAFNDAAGRDLSKLPATYALLSRIQMEASRVISAGKHYFRRLRPYGIEPDVQHCGKSKALNGSYPSGHAGFGWSVGWALARLMPDRAPAILARAQDYALSREICGVHFQSDLEASHAAAVLIADRLLADPRLADQVAAARRELTHS